MTISKLIEILKPYDQNAVVVLADYYCGKGKFGVVRLRAGEIQPVELNQVEHKALSWYELDVGVGSPVVSERTVVFDEKVKTVVLVSL